MSLSCSVMGKLSCTEKQLLFNGGIKQWDQGGSGGERWKVNDHSSEVSRDAEPCSVNNLNSCFWKPLCVFLLDF